MHSTSDQITSATSRRAVLAGAGAVGAAGLLAACGSDGDDGMQTTAPSDAAAVSEGTALTKKADIPVGGGKIFADRGVVVTQPTEGEFVAFSSICTHQGCPVTDVADGKINCACHSSAFSITDGSVVKPPATKALDKKEIIVEGDEISLA